MPNGSCATQAPIPSTPPQKRPKNPLQGSRQSRIRRIALSRICGLLSGHAAGVMKTISFPSKRTSFASSSSSFEALQTDLIRRIGYRCAMQSCVGCDHAGHVRPHQFLPPPRFLADPPSGDRSTPVTRHLRRSRDADADTPRSQTDVASPQQWKEYVIHVILFKRVRLWYPWSD